MTPKLLFLHLLNILQPTLVPWLFLPGLCVSRVPWSTVLQEAAWGLPISCSGWFLFPPGREKWGAAGARSKGIAAGHAPEAGRRATSKGEGLEGKTRREVTFDAETQELLLLVCISLRGWILHCREFGPQVSPNCNSTAVALMANPFT